MSIISIANQKGGVGKTTTTIHLADFLSQKKLKTLIIDFDPQAHSTFSLCGHGHKAKKSLMDCFQIQGKNLKSFDEKTANFLEYLTSLKSLNNFTSKKPKEEKSKSPKNVS
jgi:cellulose biosynthesis protein BcsQ